MAHVRPSEHGCGGRTGHPLVAPHAACVDVVAIIRCSGGTASHADLTRDGRGALRAAIGARRVVRVARGVYALPHAPPALKAAASVRGVVSHSSAAQLWLLETVHPPDRHHVTVPRSRNASRGAAVMGLHYADLRAEEARAGVTSRVRTVVDCARSMAFGEALAIADSALRHGVVTRAQLVAAASAMPRAGRRRVLRVVRSAHGEAANPFESLVRALLIDAGLIGFVPQLTVRGRGWRYRVDLGDEVRRIVLEADSFAWDGDRAALARDARRYDELVVAGWLVLRFTWEQVLGDPGWVVSMVRGAIAQRERRAA